MSGRVLIIDDDPVSHEVLGEYLGAAGFEVLHATDGAQGLELAGQHRPDLILLDVQMPVLDGFQTLAELKRGELQHTPVLFLTQLAHSYLKVKGLELGADDYITKPFDKAELVARINAALRRRPRTVRPEAVLHGELGELRLTDVLNALELGPRTARVRLPAIDAEITVRAGLLLTARQGTFEGRGALQRILLLEQGAFWVELSDEPSPQALGPLTTALMNALTFVDEVRALLAGLPAIPGLDAAALVARAEGDLKENVEALRRALARRAPVDGPGAG